MCRFDGSSIEKCGDRQRRCDGLGGFRFDLFVDSLSGMLRTAVILSVFGLCSLSGSSCRRHLAHHRCHRTYFFCRPRPLSRVGRRSSVITPTTRISINSSTTLKLTAFRVRGRRHGYSLVGGTSKYHSVIGMFLAFDKFLVGHSPTQLPRELGNRGAVVSRRPCVCSWRNMRPTQSIVTSGDTHSFAKLIASISPFVPTVTRCCIVVSHS